MIYFTTIIYELYRKGDDNFIEENLSIILTKELRENILPNREKYKRLRYKFYIMTEDSLGILLGKHLYWARIFLRNGQAYWDLWFRGRSIFITPLGTSEDFYDVLCAITGNEKHLIQKENIFNHCG